MKTLDFRLTDVYGNMVKQVVGWGMSRLPRFRRQKSNGIKDSTR